MTRQTTARKLGSVIAGIIFCGAAVVAPVMALSSASAPAAAATSGTAPTPTVTPTDNPWG